MSPRKRIPQKQFRFRAGTHLGAAGKGRAAHPVRAGRKRIGGLFEKLVALQAHLRSPRGCPWDREQTHQSLRTYLVEETYEVLEALDAGDDAKLAGELGDLLLQIVFHAELAKESGRFDMGEVIERIHSKMVRRHPHVFGEVKAKTSAQVLKNWEQLKAEERHSAGEGRGPRSKAEAGKKNGETSLLDGVPKTLPAVLEAYQLTRRASRVGFDWDNIEGLLEKLAEETAELREALNEAGHPRTENTSGATAAPLEEEVGDLLFVAANVARFLGVDPEIALKKTNRKFIARFREMERQAARQGRRLADASKDELEALWEASKRMGDAAARAASRK